ncbi:MAG: hypothetical protein COW30_15110 [Rhodospirillales bacterium CG15_BIG_FIL_POST_REV_8_21_14_020_66_15]|nr:MAG: hypothetical protein COW30_15110 [Rhodospirillales bacterium CG15_BIG_FIL_POST_REV_8_21_14_020_66_15]
MTNDLEQETRRVFDAIHRQTLGLDVTKKRLRSLISPAFLGVDEDFLVGKRCGDFGCGSSVNGTVNLLELGAEYVCAMDVNESFIEPATAELKTNPTYDGRWRLDVGSLSQAPYEDAFFDFVICLGVIHHVDDDRRAVQEIYRTLKPGGHAHIFVAGEGGLISKFLMQPARVEYRDNPAFAQFIDSMNLLAKTNESLDWLLANIDDDGSEAAKNCLSLLESLKRLVDHDFELTVLDRLQAPIYKAYTEDKFTQMLEGAGFRNIRRLRRRPHFDNVRKILAPMYENYDHELSKLLLGTGSLLVLCEK